MKNLEAIAAKGSDFSIGKSVSQEAELFKKRYRGIHRSDVLELIIKKWYE
ncbi:hypothetical protein [Chryseobacterium sp. W4I1]|nr:hypothetical protein [Chryseobacterium sp. W4I1]MDQ0783671.1 hypothetical protein [Chryseobacterium sp. W4I1]